MTQPDIVHRNGFLVLGTVTRRQPGAEGPQTFTSIWRNFEAHHEIIKRHSTNLKFYGVSFGAAEDGSFQNEQ